MSKDIAVVAGDLVVRVSSMGKPLATEEVDRSEEPGAATDTGLAQRSQRGMVSAEWAVGIVAAVAVAGVLLAVITSGQFQDALLKFVLWVIGTFVSVVD